MKYIILGAGISGIGAAKLIHSLRGTPYLYDDQPQALTATRVGNLPILGSLAAAQHFIAVEATGVIVSPGVSRSHPLLVTAREHSVPIVSELAFALRYVSAPIIAVTGTNGKSTTVMMIQHLLQRLGVPSFVGGNIGLALSQLVAENRAQGVLVLEASSYQLEMTSLQPQVAIITSFSVDHVSRHGTMRSYLQAKWSLFSQQREDDCAILAKHPWDQGIVMGLPVPTARTLIIDPDHLPFFTDTSITGICEPHNRLNAAMSILAVAKLTGDDPTRLAPLLRDYQHLPHRCQFIGTAKGRRIVDDSKGTNVEATCVALQSLQEPTLLLLGGVAKDDNFSPLLEYFQHVSTVVAFGRDRHLITASLGKHIEVLSFPTLKEALPHLPRIVAERNCGVLLSPACASLDEFNNFAERGEYFQKFMTAYLDVNAC